MHKLQTHTAVESKYDGWLVDNKIRGFKHDVVTYVQVTQIIGKFAAPVHQGLSAGP